MNIKTIIEKIPNPWELEKRLLAYAKIDYLMNHDEEEYKVYHYDDKEWIKNGHFFRIDNGGGDHYHILISPMGSVIKGFGHESEMSPYNLQEGEQPELIKNHNFYQDLPDDLFSLLNDDALEKEVATFCIWQSISQEQWTYTPITIPDDWNDGSEDFLNYVFDLEEYAEWFEESYEEPIDMDLLKQIYKGMAVTKEMIEKLPTQYEAEVLLRDFFQNF